MAPEPENLVSLEDRQQVGMHDPTSDRHFLCRQAIAGNIERKANRVFRADLSMIVTN